MLVVLNLRMQHNFFLFARGIITAWETKNDRDGLSGHGIFSDEIVPCRSSIIICPMLYICFVSFWGWLWWLQLTLLQLVIKLIHSTSILIRFCSYYSHWTPQIWNNISYVVNSAVGPYSPPCSQPGSKPSGAEFGLWLVAVYDSAMMRREEGMVCCRNLEVSSRDCCRPQAAWFLCASPIKMG